MAQRWTRGECRVLQPFFLLQGVSSSLSWQMVPMGAEAQEEVSHPRTLWEPWPH